MKNKQPLDQHKAIQHYEKGLLSAQRGNQSMAEKEYQKAIRLWPCFYQALSNLGNLYEAKGLLEKALLQHKKAYDCNKTNALIIRNLGNILRLLGQYSEAIYFLEKGLSYYEKDIQLQITYGTTLSNAKQFDRAHVIYSSLKKDASIDFAVSCLELINTPERESFHYFNIAKESVFSKLSRLEPSGLNAKEVVNSCKRISTSTPIIVYIIEMLINNFSSSLNNWIDAFITVLKEDSKNIPYILYLSGISDFNSGDLISAKTNLLKAKKHISNNNLLLKLTDIYFWSGDIKSAEKISHQLTEEHRISDYHLWLAANNNELPLAWHIYNSSNKRAGNLIKECSPDYINGKTVYVYSDQGIGDVVMFLSCLNDLIDSSPKKVFLQVDSRLKSIVEMSFPSVEVLCETPSISQLSFDCSIRLSSLPGFYRKEYASFRTSPYLLLPERKINHLNQFLSSIPKGFNVGFAWKGGNKSHQVLADNKSCQISDFYPLFNISGVNFINLQYGGATNELNDAIHKHPKKIFVPDCDPMADPESQFELISKLDLVIQTSNASIHFSGSIGISAWCLIGNPPDWRWFSNGVNEQSAWYPSVRMIKKDQKQSWKELVESLVPELTALAASKS